MQTHYIIIKFSFALCLISIKLNSQSVGCSYGPIFIQSFQKVKIINGVNDFQNSGFIYKIEYLHKLKLKKAGIKTTLNYFTGGTTIAVDRKFGVFDYATGFDGLKVTRIDIGMYYDLIKSRSFFLKLALGIGSQFSRRNGKDPFDSIFEIFGPDYEMTEPIKYSYNYFQLLPLVSAKFGFVAFKRIELFFDIQGTYGFKSYQTMELNYKFKGIQQKAAIVEARGTGLFPSIGIGYRFMKEKP